MINITAIHKSSSKSFTPSIEVGVNASTKWNFEFQLDNHNIRFSASLLKRPDSTLKPSWIWEKSDFPNAFCPFCHHPVGNSRSICAYFRNEGLRNLIFEQLCERTGITYPKVKMSRKRKSSGKAEKVVK